MEFKNKNIVITGGSGGIGLATAIECARLGARIALVADGTDKLKNAADQVRKTGAEVFIYSCDISNKDAVRMTGSKIFSDLGVVDVLINNAGFATYHTFAESSLDEIARLSEVNYLGAVYFSKVILDGMLKARQGHVINVASVAGRLTITPNAAYAAAKHGLVALTELLKAEYSVFNIHFSLMLPGRVDTAFFDHASFKTRRQRPEHAGMMSAQKVAHGLVCQIRSRQYLVVMPWFYRVIFWINDAFPWIAEPLLRKILKARIREHYDTVGWPL